MDDRRATCAGDQDQTVFGTPAVLADAVELAQRAVLDRIRLGRGRRRDCRLESRTNPPVVRREIVIAKRARLSDAEENMHVLRSRLLNCSNAVAVEAELQHVGRLLRTGQLRVERLVAPRPELRHACHPKQEVGPSPPLAVNECRLSDDVRACPHRLHRTTRCGVEIPALVHRNLDNVSPFVVHPREEIELV